MDIIKLLQAKIGDWEQSTIQVADGLDFNQYQTLRRIEFYTSSRYLTGFQNRDSRGRIKPFYNITNYRINIATRATDLDTKDIQIVADEPKFFPISFILQKEVYNWMKEVNFAKTLNEMGFTRAKYGGVLIKKCVEYDEDEKQDELEVEVVDWRNVITDPVNPTELVIEKHYMTPADLSEMIDVWDNVKDAIDIANKSTDQKALVYEMTGVFPTSYATSDNGIQTDETGAGPDSYGTVEDLGDSYKFQRQKFYILKNGKSKHMVLYHEFLDENPYMYLAWEKVPGRGLGRGVTEDGFEAQMWTNDSIVREKEAMELGSKVIFKTTDPDIQNNILTEVENGQVIRLKQGNDFAIANTITNALPEFSRMVEAWNSQYERVSSTFGAISGETMPSNTPYRTVAILNQEATSMFDYRREEMGIFLTELFNEWIIPFLIKRLNKAHILRAEFTADELQAIDNSYANYVANEEAMKTILSGTPVYAEDYEQIVAGIKESLKQTKAHRFLDIPKGLYKNFEAKVTVQTTGEQKNKSAILETLNNLLLTVSKAPQILQDPKLSLIFSKILETSGSGISPISLGLGADASTAQPAQPQPAPEAPVPGPAPMAPQLTPAQ